MAAKKININELRSIVREIIDENLKEDDGEKVKKELNNKAVDLGHDISDDVIKLIEKKHK